MKRGIDVSMFVDVDILKYKPDFVIIRGGEGVAFKDSKAKHYAKVCEDNNIPYGVYWVLDFSSGTSAQHAAECLRTVRNLPGRVRMGIWADCETPASMDNVAIAEFCQKIQDAGYYAGIYTGINYLRNGKIKVDAFDKWAAYYGEDSGDLSDFESWEIDIIQDHTSLWQYASGTGKEPDLDICFLNDLSVYDVSNTGSSSQQPDPPEASDPQVSSVDPAILEELDDIMDRLKRIREYLEGEPKQ